MTVVGAWIPGGTTGSDGRFEVCHDLQEDQQCADLVYGYALQWKVPQQLVLGLEVSQHEVVLQEWAVQ